RRVLHRAATTLADNNRPRLARRDVGDRGAPSGPTPAAVFPASGQYGRAAQSYPAALRPGHSRSFGRDISRPHQPADSLPPLRDVPHSGDDRAGLSQGDPPSRRRALLATWVSFRKSPSNSETYQRVLAAGNG